VNGVHEMEGVAGWRVIEVHDMDERCCSNVPLHFYIFWGHEGVV
jgi:hypothetical protein